MPKPSRPRDAGLGVRVSFRFPQPFLDELDAFAAYLAEKTPGVRPNRTMALQVAALRGIAVMRGAGEGVGEE